MEILEVKSDQTPAEVVDKVLTEEELGEDATCCTEQHAENIHNGDAMDGDTDD